jgi:putative NIF3 family GTP cyclohydrolase 1 type 2
VPGAAPEPTFWTGEDNVQQFLSDPLYKKKLAFIKDHGLVVWRFHDNLHARRPDMSSVGLAQDLGWTEYASRTEQGIYVMPSIPLRELAKAVEKRMRAGGLRVIGDPDLKVTRAALMQGAPPFHAARTFSNVDVIVAGEQREWEGVEYAFDANTAGEKKGMIIIGHWISEEGGMRLCADWLKTFISEAPVKWIPAGDPFWRP